MNILILTPSYPYAGNPTEGIFNKEQAKAFIKNGHNVTVIVCKPLLPKIIAKVFKRYNYLYDIPKYENRNNIKIFYVRYLHIPRFRFITVTIASYIRTVIKLLKNQAVKSSFDIIQVQSTWPAGLAAPKISKFLACPYVLTLHIQDDPRLFRKSSFRFYREMFRKAAALISVGKPLLNSILPLVDSNIEDKIAVIPNGIDVNLLSEIDDEIDISLQSWGHIITIANLWPVKGIDTVLRALAILKEQNINWINYVIVGDGPEKQSLQRLANKFGIQDRVTFLGRLSHEEALRQLAKSDIFCLPSWQESFGIVYLEAMGLGKATVGCFGQGAEDLIQNEKNGLLIEPKNADSLARVLKRLLSDPSFAKLLGEQGRTRAKQFTWEKNVLCYQEIYHRCINQ